MIVVVISMSIKIIKIIVFCLIPFYSILTFGNEVYTLKCGAKHLAGTTVELLDFYGTKKGLIETAAVDGKGLLQFQLSKNLPVGLYRLRFNKNMFLDVIYNLEDISISIKPPNPQAGFYSLIDNTEILLSIENKLYYEFQRVLSRDQNKSILLNQLKTIYSPASVVLHKKTSLNGTGTITVGIETSIQDTRTTQEINFYSQIENELKAIQPRQKKFMHNLISNNQDTYVAKMIKNLKNPEPDISLSRVEQISYYREHFFDNVDFDDITLLHSNVIPAKVRAYINLYMNGELNKEQQDEALIRAVDNVMSEAEINDTVYDFVLNTVSDGFEKSDNELVLTYIIESYGLKDSCKNEDFALPLEREASLQYKIEKIKRLAVGKIAPEIRMQGNNGMSLNLSDIKAKCTLVLFWASFCQHCTSMMPDISVIYEKYKGKGLQILAISIDEDSEVWGNAVKAGGYTWINYIELKGWESRAVIDYNVWETPKMYLLNHEKKIIAKPASTEELESNIITLVEKNVMVTN